VSDAVVTAIVPVGPHHPVFLRRALDSLLAQTDPRWRALVVAEPDVRLTIADVLRGALDDRRVRLLEKERRGLAASCNLGMAAAETEFVALLLGDDMWSPQAVAVLAAHLRAHPDADFLYSGRVYVDEHDEPISSPYLPVEHVTPETFARTSPLKHLLCWRRELGLAVGGVDERIRFHGPDDYDFPWTMAEHGARLLPVPEPLYLYRDHRESFRLTTHVPLSVQTRELRRVLRKHGLSRRATRQRIARARATYLQQALYRSRLDRWWKRRSAFDPRTGWRESYR
jgi:glycosyltransferase involved in cell wall biosynthesis